METVIRVVGRLSRRTQSIVLLMVVVPLILALCAVTGMGSSTQTFESSEKPDQNPYLHSVEKTSPKARLSSTGARAAVPYFSAANDQGFLGEPEQVVLDRLIHNKIVKVKDSPGGRSVAFRLTLEDGTRAFYKPEQTFSAAQWYAEVVAHYLDRALGLNRVPPTVSRRFPWAKLSEVAKRHPRKDEVVIAEDGTVKGALIFWLPKRLKPLQTPAGWENWIRIEPWPKWKISPCQRPKLYTKALNRQRANRGKSLQYLYYRVPSPDRPERGAELSDMLVFDFLTLNVDRWGGNNCNVLLHGTNGPLIFLDNGAGFSVGPARRNLMDVRLQVAQRFRRTTIEALRKLDMEKFEQLLKHDRLAPLLTEQDFKGLEIRRRAILDRVSKLRAKFGDKAVLPW